jgi:hypothetical protein
VTRHRADLGGELVDGPTVLDAFFVGKQLGFTPGTAGAGCGSKVKARTAAGCDWLYVQYSNETIPFMHQEKAIFLDVFSYFSSRRSWIGSARIWCKCVWMDAAAAGSCRAMDATLA